MDERRALSGPLFSVLQGLAWECGVEGESTLTCGGAAARPPSCCSLSPAAARGPRSPHPFRDLLFLGLAGSGRYDMASYRGLGCAAVVTGAVSIISGLVGSMRFWSFPPAPTCRFCVLDAEKRPMSGGRGLWLQPGHSPPAWRTA